MMIDRYGNCRPIYLSELVPTYFADLCPFPLILLSFFAQREMMQQQQQHQHQHHLVLLPA